MAPDDDKTQAVTVLSKGTVINHYRIIEKIGAGGMGEVYLAEDIELNRKVALKFLSPHLCQDADCRARFKREAQAAAKLDHPNIVTVYEVGEFQGRPFFAMQHIEGRSLKEHASQHELSIPQVLEIGIQIAEGLQAAHERGVTHRDIKPANVLIDSHGRARILDFGLASVGGTDHLTKTGSTLGTVGYMSPEQVRGEQVDQRTDIFSLGVVLYELITGRQPFKRDTEAATLHAIAYDDPAPLPDGVLILGGALQRIISRSLDKAPDHRWTSAAEMATALHQLTLAQQPTRRSYLRVAMRPAISIPIVLIVAVAVYWLISAVQYSGKVRWAREVILPAIDSLAAESRWEKAYFLAQEAESYIHNDPMLTKLWSKFSVKVSIKTNPADARVYLREYTAADTQWLYLGRTPIDSAYFPLGSVRVRIERAGFVTLDLTAVALSFQGERAIDLDSVGSIPTEMVRVRRETPTCILDATGDSAQLGDYFIDKFEATNREYKEFVDSGGYRKKLFWKYPVIDRGQTLSWEQSMAEFVDATGRPGPSTWEMGTYRKDEADYPVGGISWYEAAAYAEFREKTLPTVYHWNLAAFTRQARYIIPASNFSGSGPTPVGQGITACGAYDLAGNVREWCFNQSGSERCILGGGWNDQSYSFMDLYAQPPLDRSPTNGVRCVKILRPAVAESLAYAPIKIAFRNFMKEKPVSDRVFRQYLSIFEYDHAPLNEKIESRDSADEWISQKVSFDAAYGGERMTAYVFLPKGAKPPLQVVVFFPGSDDIYERSSSSRRLISGIDFIVKSGRALAYPILKGTFERGSKLNTDYPNETVLWRDHVVAWAKDIGRTIDYLETRSDIDTSKIAYFGWSWGGEMGAIMPAIERRFKVTVLNVAGLSFNKALPEVDAINFIGHIKMPVLMLNGKYDYYFPYETSQLPMFRLLGTAPNQKKQVVYETSHFLPRNQLIREILNWLDLYLGSVEAQK